MEQLIDTTRESRDTAGVLFACNFPPGTGFAWDFIESLIEGVAALRQGRGSRLFVSYPSLGREPGWVARSRIEPVELNVRLGDPLALARLIRAVRRLGVGTLVLFDRPGWHPAYALLRLFGLGRIIVYDHSSGLRSARGGLVGRAKRVARRLRLGYADEVLVVSRFVARRKTESDHLIGVPVTVIWNSIELDELPSPRESTLRRELGVSADVPVIFAACRATSEKGVQHLLDAFDMLTEVPGPDPILVFCGDGPFMRELEERRANLDSSERVRFLGYRTDLLQLLAGATVAVVPSVWQEAFALSVLEPMAMGVPVVASAVGGIPEVVHADVTGLLVPPGDPERLAVALRTLLLDPDRRSRMGRAAEARAKQYFSRQEHLAKLGQILFKAPDPSRSVGG